MHLTNVYGDFSIHSSLEWQKRKSFIFVFLTMRKISIFSFYNLSHYLYWWIFSCGNDTREWLKSGERMGKKNLSVDLPTLKAPFWNTGIAVSKDYFAISPHGTADNRFLLSLEARKWWQNKMNEIRNWKEGSFSFIKEFTLCTHHGRIKPPPEKRKLACDCREVTEALWNSAKTLMVFVRSTSWVCCETMNGKGFTNVKISYRCMCLLLGPYVGKPTFISDLESLKTFACF